MNDRRASGHGAPAYKPCLTRPKAPPPPAPPPSTKSPPQLASFIVGEKKTTKMQRESQHAYTVGLTGAAAPSSEAATDVAHRGQQRSLRRTGVNNRAVAASTGHCNGNSVPNQSQPRINTTYEVYHIHRRPENRSSEPKTYCYLPSAGDQHHKDLSQGSCDNTPATPDSLDSLGGSDTQSGDISAVSSSSALHRLQSDDEASGQGTVSSTFDNNVEADNNNTIKPEQRQRERDNLIEELTTLITATRPYQRQREEQTPSPQVSSSSPASTPDNQDKTMSSSSSSSSTTNGGLSSSLTPSTVVVPPSNTMTSNAMSSPMPRRYYFEGGGSGSGGGGGGSGVIYSRGQPINCRQPAASPREDVPVYEQLTSTMLRRSRSQQLQGKTSSSLSVGNTPPLPAKHVMNSHYMPLQAYQQVPVGGGGHQRACHYQDTRRSNPQIHYATELVLTPHQAQQIQQSLVNRYATIGRNYHISVGCDQQTAIKADVHQRPSTVGTAAQLQHGSGATPLQHPDTLAMRINNNLIKGQIMTMSHKEVPLADVRRLPEVATPTTVSMTSKRLSSSEDILSAGDSTTDCCDEDGRLSPDQEVETEPELSRPAELEEERVRKHTLLSTLVMPRPQRKPPFTIEAAMNKLLGRSKKQKENAATISETAASSKKTETNGRRLKASPLPKKPVVTNGASDEATARSTSSVLDNNSMVRTLRQAGSDCASSSNAFREDRGLLPSDEEPTLPDYSDRDVVKNRTQVQCTVICMHVEITTHIMFVTET